MVRSITSAGAAKVVDLVPVCFDVIQAYTSMISIMASVVKQLDPAPSSWLFPHNWFLDGAIAVNPVVRRTLATTSSLAVGVFLTDESDKFIARYQNAIPLSLPIEVVKYVAGTAICSAALLAVSAPATVTTGCVGAAAYTTKRVLQVFGRVLCCCY